MLALVYHPPMPAVATLASIQPSNGLAERLSAFAQPEIKIRRVG
jgi:hypothetical protein